MADKSREIMDALVDAVKYAGESGAFGKVLCDNPTGAVSGIKSEEEAQELIDAIKNGDFTVVGIGVIDECDDACEHHTTKEDKERFETIVDALCCALLHDNDSATCMFSQWRTNKIRLERIYKREEEGRLTSERAEQVRENYRHAMTEFEIAFINSLLGEYYDLIEPMPLSNKEIANVVLGRFIKNYAMIEEE